MEFRTIVDIPKPGFQIEPLEPILFVGSCFTDSIGKRFQEEHFPVTINPYGVMYNPASVHHTIFRFYESQQLSARSNGTLAQARTVFITLGTNHVYRLKETGEIVDNCQKRPQRLFQEEELSVDQCADYLLKTIELLLNRNPQTHIVLTVSPIRYAKYGFHGSQMSKATLLLAVDKVLSQSSLLPLPPTTTPDGSPSATTPDASASGISYFPAYEIILDELRDYRFYQSDMIHPSEQAVEYIWQQLVDAYFSPRAKHFLKEWKPIKDALRHRPFHPESDEYQEFLKQTLLNEKELLASYNINSRQ